MPGPRRGILILPCLGRIEVDRQNGKPQDVSVEDSTACIHGSHGYAEPASGELRSEPWIVAALAKAVLAPNPKADWDGWVADYGRIRDAIERTYAEQFKDFNKPMWQPGGFHRPLPACHRNGRPRPAKPTLSRSKASPPTSRPIRSATTSFSSPPSAARASSTPRIFGSRPLPRRARHAHGSIMNENDIVRLELRRRNCWFTHRGRRRRLPPGRRLHRARLQHSARMRRRLLPRMQSADPLWHHAKGSFVPALRAFRCLSKRRGRHRRHRG